MFFVNQTWLPAKDLKLGDSLFAYAAYKIALDSIYTFRTETPTAVYNLEAADNHNYYVSESGVLVHNKDPKIFSKSLVEQADDIVKLNGGNSVTIKTVSGHIRYDLAGKAHGGVPTPHFHMYQKNYFNGMLKSSSKVSKFASPMTQQDIRIVRNYLKRR